MFALADLSSAPFVVQFNPIAIQLGPLAVHWYALAYLSGFLLGWRYIVYLAERFALPITRTQIDDFLSWAIAGVLLGGRLGYAIFYQPDYFLAHPLEVFALWQGGMSFHGGLVGIITATLLFARRHKLSILMLADLVAAAGPIGLFFGRLANFINGELYGRVTTSPVGMIFPRAGDGLPRYPSPLFEAALEGLVLFIVLFILSRTVDLKKHVGLLGGTFLAGYGLARFAVEFFREPDVQLGYLIFGASMGQLLSLPMIFAGIWFIVRAVLSKK